MWNMRVIVNRMIQINSLVSSFTAMRDKNYVYHGESHDYWEMVYIIEGTAGIAADERVYECDSGTVIFHKPNEFHRIWAKNDSNLKFMIISFSTNSEIVTQKLSNAVMSLSEKAKHYILELIRIIEEGAPQVNLMPSYFRNESAPYIVPIFVNTLELLLYECATFGKVHKPETNKETLLFSNAVQKMKEYISLPVKTQQIADELHVSISNLKRVFNRYAMLGVHEYFISIKISYAKELLLQDVPIYLVAEQVGFYNQNNFSAMFKRETGMTPTQWMKSLGEN